MDLDSYYPKLYIDCLEESMVYEEVLKTVKENNLIEENEGIVVSLNKFLAGSILQVFIFVPA